MIFDAYKETEMDMLTAMKNFTEEQPETLKTMLNVFRIMRQTEGQLENSVRSMPAYQRTRANFIESVRQKQKQIHKPNVEVSE